MLEHVFRCLDWSQHGLNVNGVKLNHLKFADDLILIADNLKSLQEMLKQQLYESDSVNLSMNTAKTKVMTNFEKIMTIQ